VSLVHAKCLAFAWDSQASKAYNPDAGPLPDGLYEIDTDSQLATLKTLRGDWLFQYPGHEGRAPKPEDPKPEDKPVTAMATATIKEVVEAKAVKPDKRKVPMTAERKAQLAVALAKGRAAKKARLEAAAA
jgi:hypothetical protein